MFRGPFWHHVDLVRQDPNVVKALRVLFKQFSHTIYHTQGDAVTLMQSNTLLRQWHVLVNTTPTEAEYRRETGATKPSDDTTQAFLENLEMKTWPMDDRLPI